MGAMMPLTMRPTGGHSPVYADRQDWTILDDGKPVGRVYEDASASTRWFWSITVYVDPRAGICASGKGHDWQPFPARPVSLGPRFRGQAPRLRRAP